MKHKNIYLALAAVALICMAAMARPAFATFLHDADRKVHRMTVVQALSSIDGERCELDGYVEGKVGGLLDSKHIFKDSTGIMEIDIDESLLNQLKITPKTRVRLIGEISAGPFRKNIVKVKTILLIENLKKPPVTKK